MSEDRFPWVHSILAWVTFMAVCAFAVPLLIVLIFEYFSLMIWMHGWFNDGS